MAPSDECRALGVARVLPGRVFAEAGIVALPAPLTPETRHLVDAKEMKPGVMLVNSGRRDFSSQVIRDDAFARPLTLPNELITGHRGLFTQEAPHAIARTALESAVAFERGARGGRDLHRTRWAPVTRGNQSPLHVKQGVAPE